MSDSPPVRVPASGWGYLRPPAADDRTDALFQSDRDDLGFVMNLTRLWAQLPEAMGGYSSLAGLAARAAGLTPRQRSIVVSVCASSIGDSYCSLVWGAKLAGFMGPAAAAAVLVGDDTGLDPDERVLARWTRLVSVGPGETTAEDVAELRATGLTERQIFALTFFAALRAAFATVNDALGVLPDAVVAATAPASVRAAVTFGRPVSSPLPACA